jgi:hypothetical protein
MCSACSHRKVSDKRRRKQSRGIGVEDTQPHVLPSTACVHVVSCGSIDDQRMRIRGRAARHRQPDKIATHAFLCACTTYIHVDSASGCAWHVHSCLPYPQERDYARRSREKLTEKFEQDRLDAQQQIQRMQADSQQAIHSIHSRCCNETRCA